MRKRIFAVLIVMSLLIIGGLFYAQGVFASHTVVSKVDVVAFRMANSNTAGGLPSPDAGDAIQGASMTLRRTSTEVHMELNTNGLPPGAYSIWWAIDNDGNPVSGASPGDEIITGVEVVRRATGGIVGANGVGNFRATLPAAPFPPANPATIPLNIAGMDFDPWGASIAIVIRYHGPVIAGAVDEQTNLFAGGCSNAPISGLPGALVGGNVCFDPQATNFHGR